MASYVRAFRAVDAVFFRFKKKDKVQKEDQGSTETAGATGENPDILNVTAVQEFQVFDNEGIVRQTVTKYDALSLNTDKSPTTMKEVTVGEQKSKVSGDTIQMDEVPSAISQNVAKDPQSFTTIPEKSKLEKILPAMNVSGSGIQGELVSKGIETGGVVDKAVNTEPLSYIVGNKMVADEHAGQEFGSNMEPMQTNGNAPDGNIPDETVSGTSLQMSDDVVEGRFECETVSQRSSLREATITRSRSSLKHSGSMSDSGVGSVQQDQESKMDKVCCDMEPKFFLNKVKFYPAFAVINFLGIATQYVFNALSSTGPDGTIFLNKTGDLSDKYYTAITPAGWTFSIWGFIYAWQSAWVIFTLVNICRRGSNGKCAYVDPPYIPNTVFFLQLIISALNITWLITFDREEIEVAAAALIAYTLLQYLLLTVSLRYIEQASPKLVQQQRTTDIWLHRGLIQNGIGIQLAWVNIATLLNIQMVLIYSGDEVLCADDAGTLALAILSAHVIVLPIIDMVLLDRYTRYLITPYIVVVVAVAGSISKNWDSEKTNSIFSAVIISYASALLGFKIILTIYRHLNRPRFTTTCPLKQNSNSLEQKVLGN